MGSNKYYIVKIPIYVIHDKIIGKRIKIMIKDYYNEVYIKLCGFVNIFHCILDEINHIHSACNIKLAPFHGMQFCHIIKTAIFIN